MSERFPQRLSLMIGTKPTAVEIKCTKRPPEGWVRASDGKDAGVMDWTEAHIWVERDASYTKTLSTLLHEVIHVVLETENLRDDLDISPDKEEDLVRGLEEGLMTFLVQPQVAAIIGQAATSVEAVE